MSNHNTIQELEHFLLIHLSSCQVLHDGTVIETRQRVDTLKGMLKIYVNSDEHAPPHFHVKSSDIDASFEIQTCKLLSGKVTHKDLHIIRDWHRFAKTRLIEEWNSSRPTDCPVGKVC